MTFLRWLIEAACRLADKTPTRWANTTDTPICPACKQAKCTKEIR